MHALAYSETNLTVPEEPIGLQSAWEDKIVGRYRRISVHQLCMAWWLYAEGHMSRRALRVYFAAHEMAERREYSEARPTYSLEELKYLVGGRGSQRADADLSADVKKLGRLGLVKIRRRTIEFARSVEELKIEDVEGFNALLEQMPHPRRVVPVPRRTLRALAAGFGRGVTAVMIATMIRSLFWHRKDDTYRVDGRTKGSWIAEAFGVSRRAVSDARARLTELGWISPVPSQQWELNKWGAHDRINPDWRPEAARDASVETGAAIVENRAGEATPAPGEIASPRPENPAEFASPDLNNSASSKEEELKTRRPSRAPEARRQARLVSKEAIRGEAGQKQPSLRDIQSAHLDDTEAVLELYRQAQAEGLAGGGEGGRLEFVALVERARAHGQRPGALLTWLLRKRRHEFITQSDEDRAATRLREHRDGPAEREPASRSTDLILSKEDAAVRICILVAKQHRGVSPERLAREKYGWTSDQWQKARLAYDAKERARWM